MDEVNQKMASVSRQVCFSNLTGVGDISFRQIPQNSTRLQSSGKWWFLWPLRNLNTTWITRFKIVWHNNIFLNLNKLEVFCAQNLFDRVNLEDLVSTSQGQSSRLITAGLALVSALHLFRILVPVTLDNSQNTLSIFFVGAISWVVSSSTETHWSNSLCPHCVGVEPDSSETETEKSNLHGCVPLIEMTIPTIFSLIICLKRSF